MVEGGSPRFQFGEIVQIVRATGRERITLYDREIDVKPLIGERFVVNGAEPTPDYQGWTIHIWVPSLNEILDCPTETLEPTGLIEIAEDDDSSVYSPKWVPLTPETARPWRDDVLLTLETHTHDEQEAKAIARRLAQRLEPLSDVSAVDWRINHLWTDRPADISMWVHSDGDALQAFAEIIDQVPDDWENDDSDIFITSTWTPAENSTAWFLDENLISVEVTYRRWTSPSRRTRAEINQDG